MAQFINAKEDLVTEAIDGVLAASGGTLSRLDGYPHIKVVFRTDWESRRWLWCRAADLAMNRRMRGLSAKGC